VSNEDAGSVRSLSLSKFSLKSLFKTHIEKFNLEEKLEEISEREGRRLLEVEEMREKLN
jgi:hypothetical protein